jgi:glycosyltransferase involved in cell wall biosynthesis
MGLPAEPELSLIVPCYNEQECDSRTPFRRWCRPSRRPASPGADRLDNGSKDRTGEILEFAAKGLPVVYHRVEPNEGYGNGVLKSIRSAARPWIGIIPADGQVDAEDVARLFEACQAHDGKVLGKVRRRFRMDGPCARSCRSSTTCLVFVLYPRLGSIDVNGSPKIMHRDVLRGMDLQSKQWFLDPELMIKAHYLGVRVLEMNVFARMRGHGLSHVRGSTAWEFFVKLLRMRFGGELSRWKKSLTRPSTDGAPGPGGAAGAREARPHEGSAAR